jgi:2-octaprenylphenol hydroxylase
MTTNIIKHDDMIHHDMVHYDIIIVGGGMVGASLACALADSSLKIALIEAHEMDFNWPEDSHDIRVSAITHASQYLFENIGAWESMQQDGVAPYTQMHVWDATGRGEIHFDSVDVGQANLGYIIENRVIQKAVLNRLQDCEHIDLLMPVKLTKLQFDKDGVVLTTDSNLQIQAKLLVGADGANSWVRQQADISLNTWAYNQTAVVCSVKTSESNQQACWQQFMPEGPLAFLPLADGQSSIVWSTTEERARTLLMMDDDAFNHELQLAIGSNLGRVEVTSARGAFPLRLRHARHYVKEHLALIGDAAHTVHPLAGQGVNLGLLDAAVLAEEIIKANHRHRNIGGLSTLRRFERRRKGDNIAMLAAMDGFKRLFSNDFGPLKLIRNAGLNLADHMGPVKNRLIKQAMGLAGELPKLARKRYQG